MDYFPVGTQFKTRGKHPRVCTIVDRWSTFNLEGELVQVRYVATHQVGGQTVTDRDVCQASVSMGLMIVGTTEGESK